MKDGCAVDAVLSLLGAIASRGPSYMYLYACILLCIGVYMCINARVYHHHHHQQQQQFLTQAIWQQWVRMNDLHCPRSFVKFIAPLNVSPIDSMSSFILSNHRCLDLPLLRVYRIYNHVYTCIYTVCVCVGVCRCMCVCRCVGV